jgi:GMP reductase
MPTIIDDVKLDFSDVLIVPKRSRLVSRKDVSLEREFEFKFQNRAWQGVPIVASNMDTTGTFEMASALRYHRMLTCIRKHYTVDEWREFAKGQWKHGTNATYYVMVSTGITTEDFNKTVSIFDALESDGIKYPPCFICVDVANGYTERFIETVEAYREKYPRKIIVAGNVVTPNMVEAIILAGANIVKVGIGNGSVCTTRLKTGVGYPQLSALIECADAAHGLGEHIMCCGGCTCPGDIAKAFGAGADFVMLGGMLAGHDECDAHMRIDINTGEKEMEFYGMSSDTAMNIHNGGVADYRASEGKTVYIPYRGSVQDTIKDIKGGLRSACTYVGASTIKELNKRTTFVKVHNQVNNSFSGLETK